MPLSFYRRRQYFVSHSPSFSLTLTVSPAFSRYLFRSLRPSLSLLPSFSLSLSFSPSLPLPLCGHPPHSARIIANFSLSCATLLRISVRETGNTGSSRKRQRRSGSVKRGAPSEKSKKRKWKKEEGCWRKERGEEGENREKRFGIEAAGFLSRRYTDKNRPPVQPLFPFYPYRFISLTLLLTICSLFPASAAPTILSFTIIFIPPSPRFFVSSSWSREREVVRGWPLQDHDRTRFDDIVLDVKNTKQGLTPSQ